MFSHHIACIDRLSARAALTLLAVAMTVSGVVAQEPASASDEKEAAAKAQTIRITGTFESARQSEVTADNEHLSALKIEKILPHGSRVTKGQVVVAFETESMDKKARDAEADLQLAKLAMEADEFAHAQFLKEQELDRDRAKRTRQIAQQEFDNYQKVDRERTIKQAKFSLESSKFSLESATEEFRQLEQMYKEDDLTEESEEIVLRRAKRSMESAAFALERTKISTDRTLKQSVPRSDATQEETLTRAMMAYDKSMHSLANERKKRELEMQRKREKLREQTKDFEELRQERKQVALKAAHDGVFFQGELTRGKPPAKPVNLKKGSSATGKQVLGVVSDPTKLQVRIDLPEEHLSTVKQGVACKVMPKAMKGVELSGVVKSVGIVPFAAGKYDCVVNIRGRGNSDVLPAMSCDIEFEVGAGAAK